MISLLFCPLLLQVVLQASDQIILLSKLLFAFFILLRKPFFILVLHIQTGCIPQLPDMDLLRAFLRKLPLKPFDCLEIACSGDLMELFHPHILLAAFKSVYAVFEDFDLKQQFLPVPYILIHIRTAPP